MALDNTFRLSNYSIPIHVDENKIFLIHGYTGAIDIVSKEFFDDLLKNKFDELDNDLISYLEKRGILTRKNLEEERTHVARICDLLKKRNLRFTPITVTIPITYDCNFDCVYCFEKRRNNIKGKIISKKQVDNIFKCLSNLKKEGKEINKVITLFGGEPLLMENREILKYIVERGARQSYKFTVISNGYEADMLLDLFGQGKIVGAQITIDGTSLIHNSRRLLSDGSATYDKIIENIILLLEKGVTVRVRVNVDSGNVDDLVNLENDLERKGLFKFNKFSIYTEFIGGECNFNPEGYMQNAVSYSDFVTKVSKCRFASAEKKIRTRIENAINMKKALALSPSHCNAHYGNIVFDPFGNIYSCLEVLGDQTKSIGKYNKDGIIWNESSKSLWYDRKYSERCRKCKFILLCGGGCFVKSMKKTTQYCDNFYEKLRYAVKRIYVESLKH